MFQKVLKLFTLPTNHISSFPNCEPFCPVSLDTAHLQQRGHGASLLFSSSALRILSHFCAIQSFSSSPNILIFTPCSYHLPCAGCLIRVMLSSQRMGSKVGGRSIQQLHFYTSAGRPCVRRDVTDEESEQMLISRGLKGAQRGTH